MIRPRTIGSRSTYRQTSDLVLSSGSVAGTRSGDDARDGDSDEVLQGEGADAGADEPDRRRRSDRRADGASTPGRARRASGARAASLGDGRCRIDPSE